MELGGIGLKQARIMKKALLTKLAWRVLTKDEELWCRVIKANYGLKGSIDFQFAEKHRAS